MRATVNNVDVLQGELVRFLIRNEEFKDVELRVNNTCVTMLQTHMPIIPSCVSSSVSSKSPSCTTFPSARSRSYKKIDPRSVLILELLRICEKQNRLTILRARSTQLMKTTFSANWWARLSSETKGQKQTFAPNGNALLQHQLVVNSFLAMKSGHLV